MVFLLGSAMSSSSLETLIKFLKPYILNTKEELSKSFQNDILNQKIISIDLESDRNERFGHNLSLIQLGTKEKQYLVDPISLNSSKEYIDNMRKLLTDRTIIKLFYSGMEDIQVLKREFDCEIANIYDVQYSLAFLEKSNLLAGLEKAVLNNLEIELPIELHKYQKTDWSIRPLSEEMMWYAAFDVAFLIDLYLQFNKQLQQDKDYNNYLRYFSSLELIEPVSEEVAESVRFLKMHDYNQLQPLEKLLAFRLHKFRIVRAKRINRPIHFILSKRDIDKIMKFKPTSIESFNKLEINRFKKDPTFKTYIINISNKTLNYYKNDPQIYDKEVKPIEELILKLGKKDLHLVNNDFSLRLSIDIEVYKQRKYILSQWRSDKCEKEHISRKDVLLSQFTINHLSKFDIGKECKIPDIQGIDDDFKEKYEEEIINLFIQPST